MKNIKRMFSVSIAVFFVLLFIAGSASAATLYVAADGSKQYKTIQSAVNAAKEGDTIQVASGTYKETVNMTSSHLTFIGKGYPKVNGFKNYQLPDVGEGDFGTEYETINGFKIMKDGVSVYGRYSSENTVRNNYFYSCGVAIDGYESGVGDIIMNNEFRGGGIRLGYLNGGWGSKITGNRIYNSNEGIYLGGAGTICDEISGNTISGCNIGLKIEGPTAGANLIYNNVFNNTVNVKLQDVTEVENWNKYPAIKSINIIGGPYIGGNYWGSLNKKGFSQTHLDTNGDGIAEVSYTIDGQNVDKLPLVTPLKAPVASFVASKSSGKAPLKIQFTDRSTGTITSWKWSFGDNTYSTTKSPSHTYSKAGKYKVSLTVKNGAGSSTKTLSGYITVSK
ncbi:NosD domain-containing protein [Methanosarcina sp.]|uniref:NosD domain-containing protein n=1 Tax=Methanosarcina sp. TaxID=2213 RepID=UPI003BB52CAB